MSNFMLSHLEIETSGRSIGVPFADNFAAEERWTITTTSSGIKVNIEAGVHWSSVPWSASMLKGHHLFTNRCESS